MMDTGMTLAETSVFLLSPWKPLLMWAPFVAWAWVVGTKLDPDSRRLRLDHYKWNMAHMAAGIAGLSVMLFAWSFYVSWFVGMLLMLLPILCYWKVRNAAVPEDQQYNLFKKDPQASTHRKKRSSKDAVLQFQGPSGIFDAPAKEDPQLETWLDLESILVPGLQLEASRINMALSQGGLASARFVHTMSERQDSIDPEAGAKVVNLLKSLAGMDLQDTRHTQYGEFSIQGVHGFVEARMSVTGSSRGQAVRIDFDQAKNVSIPYAQLGLEESQKETLDELMPDHERHGIVLLSAPAGQGLSATGYAMLGRHDAYTSNIKTLERRPLLGLEGVDHVTFDPSNPDIDYATALQSILRRDPDVVLAELLDSETAKITAAAGSDSTLQYMMLNADSAAMAIREWVRLVGDVPKAAKHLRAAVCQRLVRLLCPDCKQQFTPADPKSLRLPEGSSVYRSSGKVQVRNDVEDCQSCRGTGYIGAIGVFEVFPIDKECRQILATGDLKAAMMHARRMRMVLMQEVALKRVAAGITSIEEMSRVLGGGGEKKKPAKAQTTQGA